MMGERIAAIAGLLIVVYIAAALRPSNVDKPLPPISDTVKIAALTRTPSVPITRSKPIPDNPTPLDIPLAPELQEYTVKQCAAADPPVPYGVALAIMEHESNLQADAVGINTNGTRDYGLMQINDAALPWVRDNLGITDIMEPRNNIRAGVGLLSYHLDNHPEQHKALMAYQYGETGARRKWEAEIVESKFSQDITARADELERGSKDAG